MRLVFLGPPGVGKGTYSQEIIKIKGIPQISTGDLLRAAVKNGTALGQKAKGYMDQGALVPDDLIINMVRERVAQPDCSSGYLLDGFPRTVAQAEALEQMLMSLGQKLDRVINIFVGRDVLMKRLTGRRMCRKCGAGFNIYTKQPKKEGVCDVCGGELYQRDDDKEATILNRLDVYEKQTQPLIDWYRQRGLLKDVEATGTIPEVVDKICLLF